MCACVVAGGGGGGGECRALCLVACWLPEAGAAVQRVCVKSVCVHDGTVGLSIWMQRGCVSAGPAQLFGAGSAGAAAWRVGGGFLPRARICAALPQACASTTFVSAAHCWRRRLSPPALAPFCPCSCWASRAQPTPKNIVYGATDLLSGEQFLQQLAMLGHKSGAAPAAPAAPVQAH